MDGPERTLRAEIVARPDDDEPRRVYADLLLERGDPYGELIHVQLALAAMTDEDPRWLELRRREVALLATHVSWIEERWESVVTTLRRGFVDEVSGPIDVLVAAGPEYVAHEPVRAFQVYDGPVHGAALIDALVAGALGAPARLDLQSLEGDELARLADSPVGQTLESLSLQRCWGTREDHAPLLAGALPALTELDLSHNQAIPAWLIDAACRNGLRKVRLFHAPAQIGLVDRLASTTGLTSLAVRACGLNDRDVQALVRAPALAGLRELDVGINDVDEGLGEIARAHPDLETLGANAVGPIEAPRIELGRLTGAPWQLRRLSAGLNQVARGGGAVLTGWWSFDRLRTLDLGKCRLERDDLLTLAAGQLPWLDTLDLTGAPIDEELARALATSPGLSRLVVLETDAPDAVKAILRERFGAGVR